MNNVQLPANGVKVNGIYMCRDHGTELNELWPGQLDCEECLEEELLMTSYEPMLGIEEVGDYDV